MRRNSEKCSRVWQAWQCEPTSPTLRQLRQKTEGSVKPPSATCRVLGQFGLCSKILSPHRHTARKSNKNIAKQVSCSGSIIFYKWKFEEVSLKEIYSMSIPLDTKHIFFASLNDSSKSSRICTLHQMQ